jgi:hypothetical protein
MYFSLFAWLFPFELFSPSWYGSTKRDCLVHMVYGIIGPVNYTCSGSLRLFENRCASEEPHQAVNQLDSKKEEKR